LASAKGNGVAEAEAAAAIFCRQDDCRRRIFAVSRSGPAIDFFKNKRAPNPKTKPMADLEKVPAADLQKVFAKDYIDQSLKREELINRLKVCLSFVGTKPIFTSCNCSRSNSILAEAHGDTCQAT
jgi:hypothetical protein